jgi:hypothetical protein
MNIFMIVQRYNAQIIVTVKISILHYLYLPKNKIQTSPSLYTSTFAASTKDPLYTRKMNKREKPNRPVYPKIQPNTPSLQPQQASGKQKKNISHTDKKQSGREEDVAAR